MIKKKLLSVLHNIMLEKLMELEQDTYFEDNDNRITLHLGEITQMIFYKFRKMMKIKDSIENEEDSAAPRH